MTDIFEDRITALENKSSQGATLSPVKLWSGSTSTSVTVPGAEKYSLLYCKFDYRDYGSFVIRDAAIGIADDIGSSTYFTSNLRISNNIITIKTTSNWIKPKIIEVWGIG